MCLASKKSKLVYWELTLLASFRAVIASVPDVLFLHLWPSSSQGAIYSKLLLSSCAVCAHFYSYYCGLCFSIVLATVAAPGWCSLYHSFWGGYFPDFICLILVSKLLRFSVTLPAFYIFKLVVYSRFDCELLSRLSLVFCLGMVLFIDILNLSSHTWDFSLSMADIYRDMSKIISRPRPMWTTMSSGSPVYHERHLSGRVQCSHLTTTDDINHETRQPSMSYCMSSNYTAICWGT